MLLLFAGRRRRPTFAVIQRRLGAFPVIVFFFCEKNRSIGRYGCIGHRGKKPNKYGADTKRDSCSSMLPPLPDEQKWDMGLRQGLSIAMFVCACAHRPWGRIKVNQFCWTNFLLTSVPRWRKQKYCEHCACVCWVPSNMCCTSNVFLFFGELRCCTLFYWPALVLYGQLTQEYHCPACHWNKHVMVQCRVIDPVCCMNQGVGIVSDIFMGAIEKAKSLNMTKMWTCNFCANWMYLCSL